MRASELTDAHIGQKVSYGPAKMFSGTLVTVIPIGLDWWESVGVQKTTRVFIETTDGRCATLDADEEVIISD